MKLPPRPSRMVVTLFYGTVVAHLGPALGAFGAARERGLGALASLGVALAFALLGVFGFVARVWHGLEDRKGEEGLVAWFYVPYFVHWCACVFALVPSGLFLVVRPVVGLVTGGDLLPLAFFSRVYLLGLVVGAYGIYVRRRWTEIRRVEVRVSGLPAAFDGYTIAHLSDLHIGSYTPKSWGKRWAERANALRPDATVVTGDFVTSGVAFHDDIAEVVGALRANDGVFVSMGNHDYFGDGEPMIGYFRERGVRVLRNEGLALTRGEAALYLAAIDDTWTRRADMDAALAERPEGAPCVLLAHDPEVFPEAAKRGVDLQLSGHTHGGQLAIPFLARRLSLATLAHRFNVDVYTEGRSTLYVHPGLGTTGPPIRLGAAPAIAVITLRSA